MYDRVWFTMISFRKLIAFVCLTAFLLTAIAPSGPGLLWAILGPLLLLFGFLETIAAARLDDATNLPTILFVPLLASRAPPLA